MKRCLVITLYLIIRLFEFHATAFQFNLHQWQTIYKNGHIVATFFSTFHRYLIGNLKLVLTPLLTIEKFHPNTFAVCHVKRITVAELLCLFKPRTAFKIDKNLFKFLCRKFSSTMFCQSFTVVYLQLTFEICLKIIFFRNLDILIIHLLKCSDKSGFQCRFTLY